MSPAEPQRRPPSVGAAGPVPQRLVVGPAGASGRVRPVAAASPSPSPAASASAAPSPAAATRSAATVAKPAEATATPPIAVFVDLEDAFRKARDLDTLRTALVTGARRLAPYDCALFLERDAPLARRLVAGDRPQWRVTAASGVSSLDRRAPLPQTFEAMISALAASDESELQRMQRSVLDVESAGEALAEQAAAFPHLLWVPIARPDGSPLGALAAFRAEAWAPGPSNLLASLAGPFGHAFAALADGGTARRRLDAVLGRGRFALGAAIAAVLVLALPVRMTVLAPAEVVGARPTPVAAPLDGQVREIFVEPGDTVAAGTPLFDLVDTRARNDVEVAEKARSVATAKHRRAVQNAVANHRDGQEIAVARADLDVAEAELALARDVLARSRVSAPRDGVVVFSGRSEWIGKPITTGERVMEVVDPQAIELKIDLAVADAMASAVGTTVGLFPDGDPTRMVAATVERIGYRPVANGERQMVHRVFAGFTDPSATRLGARGTARIDGERVPLAFHLFRRPIAALRQKLGL